MSRTRAPSTKAILFICCQAYHVTVVDNKALQTLPIQDKSLLPLLLRFIRLLPCSGTCTIIAFVHLTRTTLLLKHNVKKVYINSVIF